MRALLIVALLGLSLTACGASAPAGPPSQATVDAAMAQIDAGLADATPTAAPAATEAPQLPPYASGGLGLSRAAWEEKNGQSTREAAMAVFYGDKLSVMYYEDMVQQIEYSLGQPGEPIDNAREQARIFLPQDAELIETYTTPVGQLVDRYRSTSLVERFASAAEASSFPFWIGGEPGDHIVIYRRNEGSEQVFGLVIGVGNNP